MDELPNEREIFLTAQEKPDHESRSAYLDHACAGDESLRQRVAELLDASSVAGDFLEQPPPGLSLTIRSDSPSTFNDSLADVNLDFLQSSSKPGCLGTLGAYEVVGVVGRGAFGIVLRAYDTMLNRIVAIKVMVPELARNPSAVKRFLREAQSAASVTHDHIVTIHSIHESPAPPFIVMEYVDGQSLQERLDEVGFLELEEILRIGAQMASGLAAAHNLGLVHRDVKPANILLENGVQRVKVTDFGLARAVDDVGMTQTGMITGTPQYMSPEQSLGKAVDARSDLFSLGSVLYALCTGRAAFRSDSAVATLRSVCDDVPKSIRELNPRLPKWLEDIVMKLLAKDPEDRFQSSSEVTQLLNGCLAHIQEKSVAVPPPAELLAASKSIKSPTQTLASSAFIVLATLQLFAIAGSALVACFEPESIVFTGPVFGLGLGCAVALAGFLGKVGRGGLYFGLSSAALAILVSSVIAVFDLNEHNAVPIVLPMIILYAILAIPWGAAAVARARNGSIKQVGSSFLPFFHSRTTFYVIFAIQVIGIGVAASNAAIEIESIIATGGLFGLLFALWLSLFTFTGIARERLTRWFALSAPVFAVLLTTFMILFPVIFANWFRQNAFHAQKIVQIIVLSYGCIAIPIGLYALAKELELIGSATRPRVSLKGMLVATAITAVAFAISAICLDFGFIACLGGALFVATVIVTAISFGYWFYEKANAPTPTPWTLLTLGTVALLLTFCGLVHWYKLQTDYGACGISSPVNATITFVSESGRTYEYGIDQNSEQSLYGIRAGDYSITVLDPQDLEARPKKVTIERWDKQRIVDPQVKLVHKGESSEDVAP